MNPSSVMGPSGTASKSSRDVDIFQLAIDLVGLLQHILVKDIFGN